NNGVATLLTSQPCGVTLSAGADAFSQFVHVKSRMDRFDTARELAVYDDFVYHPTAIETTLSGIRKQLGDGANMVVLIVPRSNTMRMGVHAGRLMPSVAQASAAWWYEPEGLEWTLLEELADSPVPSTLFHSLEDIVEAAVALPEITHLVIMSNGSFGGV